LISFILNDQNISTEQQPGSTVLDFVRYHKDLKGTKIGCREGDCGACLILVGELIGDEVRYRSMTSCLMPLANAAARHIVTIEGINPAEGSLTPVQQAMVDESGTQCGFCTVGFVMSLTGFCIDETAKTPEMAVSAVDGNICRCTGYKSIERAACRLSEQLTVSGEQIVPAYFAGIGGRLKNLNVSAQKAETQATGSVTVGGGTDVYVQKPDELPGADAHHVFYDEHLRGIRDAGEHIEIGASATVTDLLESPVMRSIFPDLYKHLKLVSSTPIRNMATLAGNFVNASPIGDMTVWFLALDAEIDLAAPGRNASVNESAADGDGSFENARSMRLRDLYLGYKQLAKQPDEIITTIRFKKPSGDFRFNFEKVSKRTYLDISTVNTAISLTVTPTIAEGWLPPALSEPPASVGGQKDGPVVYSIVDAYVAAGGVAPIPLYLKETSAFLRGKEISEENIVTASEIMQSEISPISDVRGTEEYKRLLLRQLFRAHFVELFGHGEHREN
jgi:xanthine dehydrogenase small subunit